MFAHVRSAALRTLVPAVMAALAVPAPAQTYPTKPVRLIVPASPAGGLDQVARLIEQPLAAMWGQPVVVDNRPGAGVMVGSEVASKAQADGYTLLIVNSNLPPNAILYDKLAVLNGLEPVTLIATQPSAMGISAAVAATTVRELIALAKSSKLTYASTGHGTLGHLTGEMFKIATGTDILHVPYKGGGPVMVALAGGEISIGFASLPSFLPHRRSGRIRILALTSSKRSPVAPEVPTVAESLPGFSVEAWTGVFAPRGTPQDVVRRINSDTVRAAQTPEVHKRFLAQGFEVQSGPPQSFASLIASDVAKYKKVIRQTGLTLK